MWFKSKSSVTQCGHLSLSPNILKAVSVIVVASIDCVTLSFPTLFVCTLTIFGISLSSGRVRGCSCWNLIVALSVVQPMFRSHSPSFFVLPGLLLRLYSAVGALDVVSISLCSDHISLISWSTALFASFSECAFTYVRVILVP